MSRHEHSRDNSEDHHCCHSDGDHDSGKTRPSGNKAYYCPMCPGVESDRPDTCPKCGMALEPRTVTLEEKDNPELTDMSRRFWVSAPFSAIVLFLAMGTMLIPGLEELIPHRLGIWLELVFATPVVLWAGWPFFKRCWLSVRTMNLNMFTLIAPGAGVSYLCSVVATIAPGVFPPSMIGEHGTVGVYFEAAAVIVTLVLLGQVLELRARSRTRQAIRALLGLAPKTARRIDADGNEQHVPLEDVQPGDRLRVRPGERSRSTVVSSTVAPTWTSP